MIDQSELRALIASAQVPHIEFIRRMLQASVRLNTRLRDAASGFDRGISSDPEALVNSVTDLHISALLLAEKLGIDLSAESQRRLPVWQATFQKAKAS